MRHGLFGSIGLMTPIRSRAAVGTLVVAKFLGSSGGEGRDRRPENTMAASGFHLMAPRRPFIPRYKPADRTYH
jgi:hypothetical protein